MGQVKIRHFVEKRGAGGKLYYWQPSAALRLKGWQQVRLPEKRSDAIAEAEKRNAELDRWRAGSAPAKAPKAPAKAFNYVAPNTLGAVIRVYETSRFFKELREKTKVSYRQNMKFLEAWGGDARVAAITPQVVETLYSAIRHRTPAKAAAVITMLRILLEAARRSGMVDANAASRAGIKGAKPSGRIWPREAVRLFVEAADAAGWHSVGTAILINRWLGQREGDILELPRSAVTGGRINIVQSKTGARVSIPDNPEVRDRILAELGRQAQREADARARGAVPLTPPTLLVCEGTKQPWKGDYFRHVFAEIRAALAVNHPTIAHADGTPEPTAKLLIKNLRHTAVTEMAIAGCTTPQIAGITGHSLAGVNQILNRYMIRTAQLADEAVARRAAYEAALPVPCRVAAVTGTGSERAEFEQLSHEERLKKID